jgi:purine-binding chemotaxis protein CheW
VESLANTATRFLTFKVDTQLYALPADDVAEVIRLPAVARIPQGPPALLGVANLRGAVLPVAGLRELLQLPAAPATSTTRAIVLDIGAAVAIVVDAVATLEAIDIEQIETRQNELSAAGVEKLAGAFSIKRGAHEQHTVAKILDIKALLEVAFATRKRAEQSLAKVNVAGAAKSQLGASDTTSNSELLVTFEIAGQEFALPLNVVEEILPVPANITRMASAETVVLGVTAVRDTLLPLLSLRGLLGFKAAAESDSREKIVVMNVAGTQVGLIADRARAVVTADLDLMDPVPPVLAARTGGESRIRSIYRGDQGRRLISILAPERLFREDVMQRLLADYQGGDTQQSSIKSQAGGQKELIFLVFRLGDDEFGLPIDTVVEVAQVPTQITRLPKTPKFLEGVINLRGDVLPVIDQRRRFDMPKLDNLDGRRLIVIKTERHRAGLIVDSVSEILRTLPANVEPAPELSDEKTRRLISGVVNLEAANRMVLLLDPTEVLTRAEQTLLDTFQSARQFKGDKDQREKHPGEKDQGDKAKA